MKNTIFYTIKSVLKYWHTFSWRFNAGFSSFFGTNAFTKKLFFYGTLMLLGLGFAPNSYGQDVGSSAVKANFGIDGDIYSGLFQFQPNPAPVTDILGENTDDWFLGTTGLGVIDEAIPFGNPASDPIPNPMTNTSFERRQSIFAPTAPFPFPVVPLAGYNPLDPTTWTGRYLWLDAVYGRDTYVKGGNAETSYFAGSGDKNSDNPSTWAIGTSGSVPQKDDIIDVYAHLRGEGIRIPDPITDPPTGNPRPFTTLWAYAGASLVVTNGNKHVDFEFFRTALETPADLSDPAKIGPDGGRTAFTFNSDGSVAIPGTIIISVDYINGGNVPSIRVRVWMSQATFDAYTTLSNSPFNVDKSVAFEKGTDSGNYGYAAINPIGGGVNMWGRVNDDFATFENSRTQAPPWNTWEGTTPTDVDMYTRYQFVEIGINLTAFGLDKRGDQSPCSNLLGSLLVKTRASGGGPNEGAFGSELKDFAGPYLFGNTGRQPVVTVTPKTACSGAAVDLTAGATTDSGPIHYYTDANYTVEILNNPPPTAYIPSGTTTIYARSESLTNPGCFGTTSFIVTVNAISPGVIAGDQTLCTPFDPAAFTITTAGTGSGVITYQWQSNTTGCGGTFANITGANSATYDAPAVSVITYFRRVATSTLNSVVCSANSNCLTITPNAVTPGEIAGSQTLCTTFDPAAFTSPTAGTGGGVVTYQWQSNTTGCGGTFTNISGATSATYDAPVITVTTYFRRVATSTLNSVACSANSNCLTVTPNAVTPGVIAGDQIGCSPLDPTAFTTTTAATGSGTLSYQWQSNTTGCGGTFTNITGATSATYDAPAVSVITYFRRVATSTLNSVACSANSNCLTVTPTGIVPGEIAGSQTLCSPFDPIAFTNVTPGSDHGTITYQWQSSTTSGTTGFSNIIGATLETYDAPAVAVKTWFRRVATSDVSCSGNSNVLVVTPNDITPGVIAGDQTLCSPFDPAGFTSTSAGSTTGGGTITYQWQSNITGCGGTFTNITGAVSATYDAPAVSVITYFRRVATSTLNNVACSANSNCLTVTPNAVTPGEIAGSQILCAPADPAAFTSTTAGTGGGAITYQWQISTTGCAGTWSNISGATSATYDAPTVSVVTNFRRVATSTLNGVPCSANSNCLTITPEAINPGEIAGSQTLCAPFDPVAFTSVTPGSNAGVITYQWQISTTGCAGTWSNISGATSATYDAPAVSVVTNFRRVATTTLNGTACPANSNCLTVTPNAVTPGEIAGSQTLCTPFDPATFTNTTAGTGGGVLTYQWQSNTTGCGGTFTNISGATSATYDAPAVSVITYFRRVATSTLNSVACSANSNCLTVTPNAVTPGVIAGDQKVCIGDDIAAFTSTTSGTGSGTLTYQWQSNTTGCSATFNDIAGATSAAYDPGVASVTTYYRRVATSTLNGVVCSDNSNCLTVTAETCAKALCTYTQGAYGNVGGKGCAGEGDTTSYTTKGLIEKALASYGGTMIVGSGSNTVSISSASCVIDALPGGGGSYQLSGSYNICSLPSSYLKNGRINNTLLAQTITLGLNIGINGALGDFTLQAGSLAVAVPQGGCGSDIPKTRSCNPDGTVNNEYKYYTIPSDVVNALGGNPTVQGLFDLANQALGGGSTNGLSLSKIAGLVDLINNAFDECRIFIGYNVSPLVCPVLTLSTTDKQTELAGFTASPVPFKDQLTIRYDFDYQSDVKIEVFNAQGGLELSKADANSFLNKVITLDLNVNKGQEQVFIVKLTTDRGSSTKKVMSSR